MIDKYFTSYQVVTPATELPVKLEDARLQLRMDDLRHDDAYIEQLIKSQCRFVEEIYDYALLTQTIREHHSRFPEYCEPMYLTVFPISSITSVTYIDVDGTVQTWSADEYDSHLDWKRPFIVPKANYNYPTELSNRPDAVKITYVAGNGSTASAIPDDVRLGILARIGRAYTMREDAAEYKTSMSDYLFKSIQRQ